MRGKNCPKCDGSMSEGYVVQDKSGMRAISSWSEGAPIRKWWGIKAGAKDIEITTLRCNRCGYLENYAKG